MFCFLFAFTLAKQPITIIPRPNSISVLEGQSWTLTAGMQIGYDNSIDGAADLAKFVSNSLYDPTGIRLAVTSSQPKLGIYFGNSNDDEYHLSMDENLVTILAPTRELLFDGFQTLLQLLPPQIFSNKTVSGVAWTAPCVVVHDKPRFQWRGLMIDVCRHFFGVDVIKTVLNGMSHYKLNVLHFHMTEDQGWRLELTNFPNLTKYGAIRDASPKHHDAGHLDGIPYGPYYFTVEDIKEIISYAAERSIQIVPEIEMPGHALAALSGYPHFSCTGGPFKPRCYWGVEPDIFCAGNDGAITFLESVLDDVLEIFDNTFIHLGGDECPRTRWESCPKCQARMKAEGLDNTDQLQCWFTQHFANYLLAKGRRLVGWDEILSGGLPFPESSVVMSWRGTSGGIKAAELGHDVVMTPNSHLYLDYWQFAAPEPYEYLCCYTSTQNVYTYNPTDGIDEKYQHHIIGVQANLWTEYVWEREDLEWKFFPRALALAETAWCQHDDKSWTRFMHDYATLGKHQLAALGIHEAGLQYGTQGTWASGDFTANKWVTIEFPVDECLNQKGHIECAFIHTAGDHDFHVKNVKLLYAGAEAGSDSHEAIVRAEDSENNVFSFNTQSKPAEKISVQAEVMCEGGDDCAGTIYVYAVSISSSNEEN
ncbi:Beta-hexosaminidase [Tritrichomonas foetus]|uniref:beta-N-acetylhexosaminidase n=1 Tax=Tritrichomonas foetus TaxID=1144522 RepID=A0A1J4KSQ4_9EUKA|nr:Beta-hexosaminidase [Tritrichomonas foetus]|eukprot:OHT14321.1 Beta-hexosaminidase [Tritrichomonas foetus]